ncbi:MAG TPA: hypothetical protein PKA58_01920 [Polyangium sp.]|nr:hypothetical protein [Polyangium sp.]
MGSAGYSFQLERTSGAATDGRLRTTVLNTLFQVWSGRRKALLPYEWKRFAADWICLGEDSLLTIEANDGRITFWFYESVAWSEGLAQHWLMLALAVRRGEFEAAFARIGYRIDPRDWPQLTNLRQGSGRHFFHGDNGIGELWEERVHWQVKDGAYEVPSTAIDDLSAAARSELTAALSNKRCRCAVCKILWTVKDEPDDVPGFSTRREGVFLARGIGAFDLRPEGVIVAAGGRYDSTWTARVAALGEPWAGIVELSNPDRHVDAIIPSGNDLVAHAMTNSGLRYVSTSSDGGKTWSEQTMPSGFGKAKKTSLFPQPVTNEVFATAQPAKTLFRSKDGGRTFEVAIEAFQFGGKPAAGVESLVVHEGRMFAILRPKGNEYIFAVSDDAGATFRKWDVPKNAIPKRIVSWSGALFCFLQQDTKVLMMRSNDGGATFATREIACGVLSGVATGPKELLVALVEYRGAGGGGVYVSTDGDTYQLAAKHQTGNVFADATGERIGFFFADQSLFSLRRG